MNQIHILDGQTNIILDYITADDIISDDHKKSLEDTLETYDFITFANRRFSQYLEKRNKIIIHDEDGSLTEFIIFEVAKYKDKEGHKAQVYTNASYMDLKKASVIFPGSFTGSPSQHVGRTLNDTGWQVGTIEGTGTRTLSVEKHTHPYEILKRIANEFDLELRFRIEHNGNKVTGRYVDLLERVGKWRGREVEFGKDLDGIRRVEKQDVVTALLGIGPEKEDGSRIEVLVEDEDALRRWGEIKNGGGLRHLIEPYEIQSTRTEMTLSEARQYTRTELNKRINSQITYETTIVDLESVPGMENKKIRFGDTIRIKDTSFNPPLYLEARVFEQTRSIKFVGKKDIKLGDFIEFTEEQVNNIWKQLQQQIQRRVTQYEMHEYTYEKIMIDQKDQTVFDEGKTFAEAIGIESKNYSDSQDAVVRVELEGYSDRIAEQYAESALEQAKMYAVSQEFYEAQMENIVRDISERAPIEYVDGEIRVIKDNLDEYDAKLEQKADGSTVYTISQVDTMLNNTVSLTRYETDMNGVVQDLESYGTRIGQNETAIGLKADDTRLDTVEQELNTKIGNLEVRADEVVINVQEVRADLNHKVDGVYVADAIDGIQVGGRNLVRNSDFSNGLEYYISWNNTQSLEDDEEYGKVLKLEMNNSSNFTSNRIGQYYTKKFTDGDIYTVSFTAKGNGRINSINLGSTGSGSYTITTGSKNITLESSSEWKRYSIQLEIKNSSNADSSLLLRFGITDETFIANIQLEKGNKATDWTPAPEDTDAQFSDVYGRVETLDASINTMAGEIELKASQSIVDSLTGEVRTLEAEIEVLPDTITLDASRINFDGHVFGQNATFEGTIQGAVINGSRIVNEYSSSGVERSVVFDRGEMVYQSSLYGEESTVSILGDQITFSGRSGSANFPVGYFDTIDRFNLFTHGLVTRPKTTIGETTFFIGASKVGIGVPSSPSRGLAGSTLELNRINFVPDDGVGSDLGSIFLDRFGHVVFKNSSDSDRMVFRKGSSGVDFPNGLISLGQIETSAGGGTSGGLALNTSIYQHVITPHTSTGALHMYPQRYAGENIFTIRSHHNKGSYRDDFYLSDVGTMYVPATYGNTTTNSANIRVGTSAGHFARNTSLRKYKLNIESAKDPYKILNLEARTWYDKGDVERYCEAMTKKNNGEDYDFSDVEYIKRIGGLVAEEVVEAGLGIYAEYDENGNLNGVAYDRAWTLLIPITRDHHREISELKTENQFLHNEIIKLKEQIA